MSEPTQPTEVEQTNPGDIGKSTTEFQLSGLMVIISAVLTGLTASFAALHQSMPDAGWIATGVVILGSLGAMVATVTKYTGTRGNVKVGLTNVKVAETNLEAAKVVAGVSIVTPPNP